MAGKFVTPKAAAVSDMLGMLYGGDVAVADSPAHVSDGYAARMIGDDGALVALIICDYHLIGFGGAALSMMPVGGAEDMIAEKDFSKTIIDNHYEVMNICTRLMMSDDSDHLKLADMVPPSGAAEQIAALSPSVQASFKVKIPRYGEGIMTFLIG